MSFFVYLKDKLAFILSKNKLSSYLKLKSVDDIISATSSYVGYGNYDRISMSQKFDEFRSLVLAVRELKPKIIMEIGTRKGGTLFTWCRSTDANLVISVDLPGGIHGGGYHPSKKRLYSHFVSDKPACKLELLQLDSHLSETLNKVKQILNGKKIDFLFIDGDHTYYGVRSDFEMYAPLVSDGGIIAFHDIVPNQTEHEDANTIEVPKFWAEIKDHFRSEEFISKAGKNWMGIGMLRYNRSLNNSFDL
jgi:predicted O-methyltransferase YrrM